MQIFGAADSKKRAHTEVDGNDNKNNEWPRKKKQKKNVCFFACDKSTSASSFDCNSGIIDKNVEMPFHYEVGRDGIVFVSVHQKFGDEDNEINALNYWKVEDGQVKILDQSLPFNFQHESDPDFHVDPYFLQPGFMRDKIVFLDDPHMRDTPACLEVKNLGSNDKRILLERTCMLPLRSPRDRCSEFCMLEFPKTDSQKQELDSFLLRLECGSVMIMANDGKGTDRIPFVREMEVFSPMAPTQEPLANHRVISMRCEYFGNQQVIVSTQVEKYLVWFPSAKQYLIVPRKPRSVPCHMAVIDYLIFSVSNTQSRAINMTRWFANPDANPDNFTFFIPFALPAQANGIPDDENNDVHDFPDGESVVFSMGPFMVHTICERNNRWISSVTVAKYDTDSKANELPRLQYNFMKDFSYVRRNPHFTFLATRILDVYFENLQKEIPPILDIYIPVRVLSEIIVKYL